ncbi:hypothetical protein Ndes2526B_g00908 [Nannochloris sp. 'desiccata']
MEDGYMDPTPLQGRIVAPTDNDDHGAPSTSTATAGRIVATTSSVNIYNGIIEGVEPSRKRLKPSSSSGETTPTLGMTAATTTAADQELQQQQQQQPSSAAKRRAPGILTTALGWARSQAADLASFQEIKASEGPEKPLPQLPLPTRRLAAAHHDMVKAAANQKKGLRRGGGGINSSLNHISTVDYQQQQQQRPVSVAFATGTDPQLASVLGAELTRLGDLAQADPAKYAALAEECKLWAAGTTASVGGLTATDLEKAQYQLKAAMQHVPFSGGGGGAPNSSDGYRSGNAAGVPMPDPRASSYFIQPGTNGGRDGNPPAGGATTHQPRQQPLVNAYSQYNNPQAHTGPGLSRLNNSSFAMNTAQGHPYYTANTGGSGGDGGGGVTHRYPRRSSRARNTKRDDVYLTLDSDDDRDDTERDDEDNEDHTGNRGWMRADMRRGPGRPRKMNNDSSNAQHYQDTYQQQEQQQFSPNLMLLHPVHQRLQHRTTPPSISPPGVASAGTGAPGGSMAFFSPNLGDVLSPFAQFLFEHSPDGNPPVGIAAAAGVVDVAVNGGAGGGILQGVQGTSIDLPRNTAVAGTIAGNDTTTAAAAAGNADADAVDYAALDEFISGLNFTNDAVLGSPSAMAMLAGAKAAAAAAGTTVVVLPGMIPTGDSGGAINYTASDINNASLQPETGGAAATGAAPLPTAPAHHLDPQNPAAQLAILDLAICKPLETPTVAGMLSLGLSKKSPTPITSPLLSPTLLALNF